MKSSIQELETKFTPFSLEKLRSIKGGTGPVIQGGLTDAQLKLLFNYSGFAPAGETGTQAQTDGFNSTMGKAWNVIMQNMYSTPLGNTVLTQIMNTHTVINLQNVIPPVGTADYSKGTHNIRIGALANFADLIINNTSDYLDPSVPVSAGMSMSIHEMFHAYQDIVKNDLQASVSAEIQAYLFANMVDTQFDQKTGNSIFTEYDKGNFTQNTDDQFVLTLNNIVLSKEFDISNYNTLVSDFKQTKLGAIYSSDPVDPITSLATNDLYNLYTAHYQSQGLPGFPTIPGSSIVLEWYNPRTGQFEDTGVGQNPDAGFIFTRSNNFNVTLAVQTVTNADVDTVPVLTAYKAIVAAAVAAGTAVSNGNGSDVVTSKAETAAGIVVTDYHNAHPDPGTGGPTPVDYIYWMDTMTGSVTVEENDSSLDGSSVIIARPTPTGTGVTAWQLDDGSYYFTNPGDVIPQSGITFLYSDDKTIQDLGNYAYNNAIANGAVPYTATLLATMAAQSAVGAENNGESLDSVVATTMNAIDEGMFDYSIMDYDPESDDNLSAAEIDEDYDFCIASY